MPALVRQVTQEYPRHIDPDSEALHVKEGHGHLQPVHQLARDEYPFSRPHLSRSRNIERYASYPPSVSGSPFPCPGTP